jgi:hypothetical protein
MSCLVRAIAQWRKNKVHWRIRHYHGAAQETRRETCFSETVFTTLTVSQKEMALPYPVKSQHLTETSCRVVTGSQIFEAR